MENLPEEMRLRRMLTSAKEILEEYPGNRSLPNIVNNIEARLKFYENAKNHD